MRRPVVTSTLYDWSSSVNGEDPILSSPPGKDAFDPFLGMFLGDSIAYGYSGDTPAPPGMLREVQRQLRRKRGDVRFIGTQRAVNPTVGIPSVSYVAFPGDFFPGDWQVEGHGGYTIEVLNAQVDSFLIQAGTPDFGILTIGTNNLGTDTVSQMIQKLEVLLTTLSKYNTNWVVTSIPPNTTDPATRAAYNAFLPSVVGRGAQFSFCDAFGALTTQDIFANHPTQQGYAMASVRVVEAIDQILPEPRGPLFPRAFRPRAIATGLAPSIQFVNAADVAQTASNADFEMGSSSFATGLCFNPSSLPAGVHAIASYGTVGPQEGFLIASDADALLVYFMSAVATITQVPGCLVANTWQRIVLTGDRTSGVVCLWVNGMLHATANVTAWSSPSNKNVTLGAAFGHNAAPGLIDTWDFFRGSGLPSYPQTRPYVEADYFEAAPLPLRVGSYQCTEGMGTSAADLFGGTALTLTGAGWATLAKPGTGYPPGF